MANKPTQPLFPLGLETSESSNIKGFNNSGTIEHSHGAVMTFPEDTEVTGLPSSVRYNPDSDEFEGYYENGGWLPLGGGGIRWEVLPHAPTATLTGGRGYLINNTTGVSTVVLPSPTRVGDSVTICDAYGKFATYPLTVSPSGNKLYGSTEDMAITTDNVSATFTWSGPEQGWIITSGVGLGQGRVYSREIFTKILASETSSVALNTPPTIVDVYADGKRLAESKYSLDGNVITFSPSLPASTELQVIEYTPIQLGIGDGSGSSTITWVYNGGSAIGGETEITLDVVVDDVPAIDINGSRQYKNLGFTFDPLTSKISLAQELEPEDEVVVIINGTPNIYNQIDYTLREVARATNVKDTEVVYFSVGAALSGYKVIYDKETQRAYPLPADIAPGTTAISLSPSAVLVHSAGSVDLGELAVSREEYVTLSGTFDSGATLNVKNELLTHTTGKYRWDGELPKEVSAGSTPGTAGGIGLGKWVSVGDASLKADLTSSVLSLRNSKFSLRDVLSLADFIPANANKDYLADTEFNAALTYAKANNIGNILLPSWMSFKLSTTELSKNTFDKIRIYCDRPAVYDENAGGTIWTDDARVFNIGIDDGNPDSTGFTRSITLENIQFGRTYSTEASAVAADTSDVAVNVVNTTHFRMKGCRSFGFKQGGFRPQGGNVLVDVDDFEAYGLTGKNATTGYGYAIQRGSSYWGTFVMRLRNIHGFQYKGFMYVGRGRDIVVENPVAENMQDSMFHLEGSGDVYSLNISNAYGELIRGAYFRADNFTGNIYKLNIKGFEAHEAGEGGYTPVLSTLNRARVLRANISGIICSDSALDAQLGTTTTGRLTESVMFQGTIAKTTAYDDDLFKMYSAFHNTDKLGLAGTFNTLNTAGNAPYSWTYINGVWATSTAAVRSGSSLKCTTGGNYDKASISLSKPNVRTGFALAVTFAGPITVKVNGGVIYQSTASGWNTSIIKFTVDDTATTFTLTVGPVTNATDTIEIAEMRVWEIGSADATEVGWTTGLTQKAIRMSLFDVV